MMSTIVVYKAQRCGYCVAAVRFLREVKNVDVEEIDLTGEWDARKELSQRTGQRTVPQIFIGAHHVGGYDDMMALERAGQLDPILDGLGK